MEGGERASCLGLGRKKAAESSTLVTGGRVASAKKSSGEKEKEGTDIGPIEFFSSNEKKMACYLQIQGFIQGVSPGEYVGNEADLFWVSGSTEKRCSFKKKRFLWGGGNAILIVGARESRPFKGDTVLSGGKRMRRKKKMNRPTWEKTFTM